MAEKSSLMGKKIEFQGKKSSFEFFGKIEFPSKRKKKAWDQEGDRTKQSSALNSAKWYRRGSEMA